MPVKQSSISIEDANEFIDKWRKMGAKSISVNGMVVEFWAPYVPPSVIAGEALERAMTEGTPTEPVDINDDEDLYWST